MKETVIYLIRHGKTESNLIGRFAGRLPEPLLEEGREDALSAAEALRGEGISLIISSRVARARETAEIIASRNAIPLATNPAFDEIYIPPWEGRLKQELLADPETNYRIWKKTPHLFQMPGAETLADVQKRALERLLQLFQEREGERLALVTHLSVARCLALHFMGLDLSHYRQIEIPHARPLALVKTNDHISFRAAPGLKQRQA